MALWDILLKQSDDGLINYLYNNKYNKKHIKSRKHSTFSSLILSKNYACLHLASNLSWLQIYAGRMGSKNTVTPHRNRSMDEIRADFSRCVLNLLFQRKCFYGKYHFVTDIISSWDNKTSNLPNGCSTLSVASRVWIPPLIIISYSAIQLFSKIRGVVPGKSVEFVEQTYLPGIEIIKHSEQIQ